MYYNDTLSYDGYVWYNVYKWYIFLIGSTSVRCIKCIHVSYVGICTDSVRFPSYIGTRVTFVYSTKSVQTSVLYTTGTDPADGQKNFLSVFGCD